MEASLRGWLNGLKDVGVGEAGFLTCLSSWWQLGFLLLGRCVWWFVPAGTVAGGVRLHGRPSSR